MDPKDMRISELELALRQLLLEVLAAGFDTATDYGWPKAIAGARMALGQIVLAKTADETN